MSRKRSVSQQGLGVLYHVAITLLGEKELAIGGEILVARVTGDDGVEVCQASIAFGAQDAAQALCFLLPRTKRPRYLNGYISIGQVDREVRHFANHQPLEIAAAKLIVELFALGSWGASSQEGSFQIAGKEFQLINVLSNDQYLIIAMSLCQVARHCQLGRIFCCQAIFFSLLVNGIIE